MTKKKKRKIQSTNDIMRVSLLFFLLFDLLFHFNVQSLFLPGTQRLYMISLIWYELNTL